MRREERAAAIGRNIKEAREALGMSQSELARRIGKSRAAVSQYELGMIVPRLPVIDDLADVLHVRRNDLMRGTYPEVQYAVIRMELTQDEEQLIDDYRALTPEKREQLRRIAGML